MAVRQIKNSWWVDFRIDHTRYRKRSPENSRAGALAYEAVMRQKMARGERINRDATARVNFAEFAAMWFRDYVVPNNKFSEQRAKRHILDASLVPYFGKLAVAQITAHHIEQYKASLVKDGYTNKTIQNRLTVLSKCLACAYEWLNLAASPPKTKWPKSPPPRTDYLTPEESNQLLSHAEGILYEMILITLRSGLRQGELKGLQWSSLDWCSHSLTVRHSYCDLRKLVDTPKHDRVRHIPLDPDVYALLLARKKDAGYVFTDHLHRPFNCRRLNARLARVCKVARLRVISWHVLRHSFASHLAMTGVPLNVVQTLLGHASITTTMRYAHVAPSSLRQAIALLSPIGITSPDLGQPAGNQWLKHRAHDDATDAAKSPSSLELSQ